jgi:hypothetical protein
VNFKHDDYFMCNYFLSQSPSAFFFRIPADCVASMELFSPFKIIVITVFREGEKIISFARSGALC